MGIHNILCSCIWALLADQQGGCRHNYCYSALSVVLQGEARSDLHTLPTASRLDVIRGLFGPEVAASLLPLELTGGSGDVSESVALDGPMGFTAEVRIQQGCQILPCLGVIGQDAATSEKSQHLQWYLQAV
jgi:hypothetical protein